MKIRKLAALSAIVSVILLISITTVASIIAYHWVTSLSQEIAPEEARIEAPKVRIDLVHGGRVFLRNESEEEKEVTIYVNGRRCKVVKVGVGVEESELNCPFPVLPGSTVSVATEGLVLHEKMMEKKMDGVSCVSDDECASGHCSQGVCCSQGLCCKTDAQCPFGYSCISYTCVNWFYSNLKNRVLLTISGDVNREDWPITLQLDLSDLSFDPHSLRAAEYNSDLEPLRELNAIFLPQVQVKSEVIEGNGQITIEFPSNPIIKSVELEISQEKVANISLDNFAHIATFSDGNKYIVGVKDDNLVVYSENGVLRFLEPIGTYFRGIPASSNFGDTKTYVLACGTSLKVLDENGALSTEYSPCYEVVGIFDLKEDSTEDVVLMEDSLTLRVLSMSHGSPSGDVNYTVQISKICPASSSAGIYASVMPIEDVDADGNHELFLIVGCWELGGDWGGLELRKVKLLPDTSQESFCHGLVEEPAHASIVLADVNFDLNGKEILLAEDSNLVVLSTGCEVIKEIEFPSKIEGITYDSVSGKIVVSTQTSTYLLEDGSFSASGYPIAGDLDADGKLELFATYTSSVVLDDDNTEVWKVDSRGLPAKLSFSALVAEDGIYTFPYSLKNEIQYHGGFKTEEGVYWAKSTSSRTGRLEMESGQEGIKVRIGLDEFVYSEPMDITDYVVKSLDCDTVCSTTIYFESNSTFVATVKLEYYDKSKMVLLLPITTVEDVNTYVYIYLGTEGTLAPGPTVTDVEVSNSNVTFTLEGDVNSVIFDGNSVKVRVYEERTASSPSLGTFKINYQDVSYAKDKDVSGAFAIKGVGAKKNPLKLEELVWVPPSGYLGFLKLKAWDLEGGDYNVVIELESACEDLWYRNSDGVFQGSGSGQFYWIACIPHFSVISRSLLEGEWDSSGLKMLGKAFDTNFYVWIAPSWADVDEAFQKLATPTFSVGQVEELK